MGISMTAFSELTGPMDDYTVEPEGYRTIWSRSGDCYLVKRHPEIPDVSWTYGNLVLAWDHVIAQHPGSETVAPIGNQNIIFPDDVKIIADYLATVEPGAEHGEDFANRLKQLQELFAQAAKLPGGVVHSS